MIYEFILIHLDKRKKRNKLSRIHLKMGGFAKVCFGYKVVRRHCTEPQKPTHILEKRRKFGAIILTKWKY